MLPENSQEKNMENGGNPYKGFDFYSYTPKDRKNFHGRTQEADRLFYMVQNNFLTTVFGKSGIGKTSLINAGVFPLLEEENFLPIRIKLTFSELKESPAPCEQIRIALNGELDKKGIVSKEGDRETDRLKKDESLWEYFNSVKHFGKDGNEVIPVLCFDQFEELFSIGEKSKLPGEEEVETLKKQLFYLLENQLPDDVKKRLSRKRRALRKGNAGKGMSRNGEEPGQEKAGRRIHLTTRKPDIRVMISMREDYLPQLNDLKTRIPSIDRVMYRVPPLSKKQVEEILDHGFNSIKDLGGKKKEKILERIIDPPDIDENKKVFEPLYLSFLCERFYENDKTRGLAKKTAEEFIRVYYEENINEVDEGVAERIEDKLLSDAGVRTADLLKSNDSLRKQFEQLDEKKIIRIFSIGGDEYMEIVHDCLATIIKEKRDRRQKRKLRRKIIYIYCALAVLIGLSGFAIQKWIEADKANQEAIEKNEENLLLQKDLAEKMATLDETLLKLEAEKGENKKKSDELAKEKEINDGKSKKISEQEDLIDEKENLLEGKEVDIARKVVETETYKTRGKLLVDLNTINIEFNKMKSQAQVLATGSSGNDDRVRIKPLLALAAYQLNQCAYHFLAQDANFLYNAIQDKGLIGKKNERDQEVSHDKLWEGINKLKERAKEDRRTPELFEALRKAVIEYPGGPADVLMPAQTESWALAILPGNVIAFNSKIGKLRLKKLTSFMVSPWSPKVKPTPLSSSDPLYAAAFTASGNRLFCGTFDGKIVYWKFGDWRKGIKKTGSNKKITSMVYSTAKKCLYFAIQNKIYSWSKKLEATPETIFEAKEEPGTSIPALAIIEQPGTAILLAGGASGNIYRSDLNEKKTGFKVLEHGSPGTTPGPAREVCSMAYNPEKKIVVQGDLKGRIWLIPGIDPRETRTKGVRKFNVSHDGMVNALAFSARGRYFASGSMDGTIRLWDIEKINPEQLPDEPPLLTIRNDSKILALHFTPDGKYLIFSDENNLRVCPTRAETYYDILFSNFKKKLSPQEWKRYVGDLVSQEMLEECVSNKSGKGKMQ